MVVRGERHSGKERWKCFEITVHVGIVRSDFTVGNGSLGCYLDGRNEIRKVRKHPVFVTLDGQRAPQTCQSDREIHGTESMPFIGT